MKIDNLNMEDIYRIQYNYDNLGILKICQYLFGVVINYVDFMNEDIELYNDKDFDLGNNNIIKSEDFESLVSIIDTINNILSDNKE